MCQMDIIFIIKRQKVLKKLVFNVRMIVFKNI